MVALFDSSIPVFRQGLVNLLAIVDKAERCCLDREMPAAWVLEARLAETMYSFSEQVRTTANTAVAAAYRIAGLEPPEPAETPSDFVEIRTMLVDSQARIDAILPAQVASAGEQVQFTAMGTIEITFAQRSDYLQKFILPNFYFHLTTAYAIARQLGVELEKRDFLGDIGAQIKPVTA